MRGLVLEGGGAKGAFTFGCLSVLKKKGIKIDVVAGTSAGALNAFLWATNSLREGEELWSNISPDRSYRRLPGWLNGVVATTSTLALVYLEHLQSLEQPSVTFGRSLLFTCLDLLLVCPILAMIGLAQFTAHKSMADVLAGLFFMAMAIWVTKKPSVRFYGFCLSLIMGSLTLVWLASHAVLALVRGHKWSLPDTGQNGASAGALFFLWIGFGGLTTLFALFSFFIDRLKSTENEASTAKVNSRFTQTSHDSTPLRATMSQLKDRTLIIPTIVTTARPAYVLDPDDSHIDRSDPDFVPSPAQPLPRSVWAPVYHRLPETADESTIDILMASAALPFGIVEPVHLPDGDHVDGGVADNLPLYPIISGFACNEIIVIRVNPPARIRFAFSHHEYHSHWQDVAPLLDASDESYRAYWQVLDRRCRYFKWRNENVQDLPFWGETFINPPTTIPFRESSTWPTRIITIAPPRHLGGIFATMRMEAKFTKPLIEMGRLAARRSLRNCEDRGTQ